MNNYQTCVLGTLAIIGLVGAIAYFVTPWVLLVLLGLTGCKGVNNG